uniref:CCHC-type domain-containing protein n=1 Tax=Chromera velia CCMP2878 TaxID=1169474 RepID=A0A0G4H9D5_9ALVE|eukprot:Cvel_25378.t1-p1 / transcript=Cvel_25378.t1 / gene=Cvel_25378 / organism=Chromera_velia_CCMP2878 / gene_product=hypothetical protein / transcript_product=hypothetical protein / location=Cvel_scaffold2867:9622-10981(+) / protein_length=353 / sequence_SO=supercontig / SO=protein_coding / is_pseudo=false
MSASAIATTTMETRPTTEMKEAILKLVREEFANKFTALDEKLDLILKAQQPKQEEAKPAKATLPPATLTLPRQAPQQKQEDEDDSPVPPLVDSPRTPVYETCPSQPHTVAFPPSRFFPLSSPKKKGKKDLLNNFPWKRGEEHRRDRRDHLSWVKLDKRMEDVIVQAVDIEWEITDKQKVNAFVGALFLEQKKEYLRDHRLQRGGVKIADLNELTWEELEDGIKFYVSIEKLENKHRRGSLRQDGRAHHLMREETAFTGRGQHHLHQHYHQGQQQREQSRGRAMSTTGGWQEVRGRSRSQSRGLWGPHGDPQNPQCYYCQEYGHFAHDCDRQRRGLSPIIPPRYRGFSHRGPQQ